VTFAVFVHIVDSMFDVARLKSRFQACKRNQNKRVEFDLAVPRTSGK
jgi:hypothetical protein